MLSGKKGLIVGLLNDKSIAWNIARSARDAGAELFLTYHSDFAKKNVQDFAQNLNCMDVYCDVSDDDSVHKCCKSIIDEFTSIDFIVYAPAFANREELTGDYLNMKREHFHQCMDISCFGLNAILKELHNHLSPGASVLALTYIGSQKVIPNYGLMGMAKAALEANVRYLSYYLGSNDIRINALSVGPVRTIAAKAIKGFDQLLASSKNNSPIKNNITYADVCKSTLYFLSDYSSGVTGQVHYIDNGYNIMGI